MPVPNEDDIKLRLTQVFQEVFDDDTIVLKDETTAADIDEWDSLNHISLVLAVEKEFGVRLKAAEVGNLADVGAMIRLLVSRATV
jgi:acyl carrier protein